MENTVKDFLALLQNQFGAISNDATDILENSILLKVMLHNPDAFDLNGTDSNKIKIRLNSLKNEQELCPDIQTKTKVNSKNIPTMKPYKDDPTKAYVIGDVLYHPYSQSILIGPFNALRSLFKHDYLITYLININNDSKNINMSEDTLTSFDNINKNKVIVEILRQHASLFESREVTEKISKLTKDINLIYKQLHKKHEEVRELEKIELFGASDIDKLAKDLVHLKDNFYQIDEIKVRATKAEQKLYIDVRTTDLDITDYNRAELKRSLPNITAFKDKFIPYLEDMLNNEASIHVGKFKFSIVVDRKTVKLLTPTSLDKYENPHNNMSCYGSFNDVWEKMASDKKIIPLILSTIQFLQGVTFGDGGSHALDTVSYVKKEGEVVYDGTID
jgi:hypothetical protein